MPIALYLIGIIQPIWNFAYGLVFSPKVWSGLIVMAVALLLFTVTGGLRGRSGRKQEGEKKRKKQDTATGPGELVASSGTTASRAQPAPAPAKRKSARPTTTTSARSPISSSATASAKALAGPHYALAALRAASPWAP